MLSASSVPRARGRCAGVAPALLVACLAGCVADTSDLDRKASAEMTLVSVALCQGIDVDSAVLDLAAHRVELRVGVEMWTSRAIVPIRLFLTGICIGEGDTMLSATDCPFSGARQVLAATSHDLVNHGDSVQGLPRVGSAEAEVSLDLGADFNSARRILRESGGLAPAELRIVLEGVDPEGDIIMSNELVEPLLLCWACTTCEG